MPSTDCFLGFLQAKLKENKSVWVGVQLLWWNRVGFRPFCCLWYVGTIYKQLSRCQPTILSWRAQNFSTTFPCKDLPRSVTDSWNSHLPRPLLRNSVWINRDRYLAFLKNWRLTDSAWLLTLGFLCLVPTNLPFGDPIQLEHPHMFW